MAAFRPATITTAATTTVRYIHTDHLGGANVITDKNGAVVETLDYYPYGEVRLDEKAGNYKGSKRKYIGEEYDSVTGLSYLNARYYNGKEGRFLSEDPVFLAMGNKDQVSQLTGQKLPVILTDPQQLNSYSYARNNPTTYLDKNGNFAFLALAVVYAPEIMAGLTAVTGTAFLSSQMADSVSALGNQNSSAGDKMWAIPGLVMPTEGSIGASVKSSVKGLNAIGGTGKIGEDALKILGGQSQVPFKTSQGMRFVDQLVNGVANEAKVGYTSLTQRAANQISKDQLLVSSNAVKNAVWNFFTSPITGKTGPSAPLQNALKQAGIGVVINK